MMLSKTVFLMIQGWLFCELFVLKSPSQWWYEGPAFDEQNDYDDEEHVRISLNKSQILPHLAVKSSLQ